MRIATVTERLARSATPAGVNRIRRALPLLRSATNSARRGSTEAGVSAAKLPAAGRLTPLSSAPRARPAVGIEASTSAPAATEAAMRLRLLVANLPTRKVRFCPCQRAVEKMQNPNEQFLSPHGDSHRFSPHLGCNPHKAGLATLQACGKAPYFATVAVGPQATGS